MKPMRAMIPTMCALLSLHMGITTWASEVDEAPLAERVAALADRLDNTSESAPVRMRLFEAASRLNDSEVRFRRQRYRAAVLIDDTEAILGTLNEWRKLEPDNKFVQMRLVDLYLATRFDSTDAKLAYLRPIVDAESVDTEVRSHAAVEVARLLIEQARGQQGLEVLRQALVLYPQNIDALEMQWRMAANAPPMQRLHLLLSILRADPSSVDVECRVAQELANVNMVQESLQWYATAQTMSKALGGIGGDTGKAYAAELLIAGQDRPAAEIASRLLEKNSADPGAWFLTLLAERGMKDRFDQVRKNALIGLLNNLAYTRRHIGVRSATTRPLGSEDASLPDLAGDLELAMKADVGARRDYAGALEDVAWLLVFHDDRVADAQPLIKMGMAVDAEDKATAARLRGWSLIKDGKLEEARTVLSEFAQTDPLSALGLLRIRRQTDPDKAKLAEDARKLAKANPSRLVGAIVRMDVGDLAGAIPADEIAEAFRDTLDRFPREIMKMPLAPQEFVAMRLTPQQVGHDFGEPMIVEVSVRNLQDLTLTVGQRGMVRDVWMDVHSRGMVEQLVPGVTFEPIDGPMRLAGRSEIRWTVRVDRGPLAELLDRNVLQAMQLNLFALTNAVPTDKGIVPGSCGIRGRTNQMLERRAASLVTEVSLQRARAVIEGTDAPAKLRLVDQVVAHLRLLDDPDAPATIRPIEAEWRDMLQKLTQDGLGVVRCWARYQSAGVKAQEQEKMAADLAGESLWYGRLLSAVIASEIQNGELRTKHLKALEGDADATVRRAAGALGSLPAKRPQTNPAN